MIYYDDAKILDAVEIKDILESAENNPTVDRLLFFFFLTTGITGRVFPCFIEAWAEDDSVLFSQRNDGRKWLMFKCTIVQCKDGEYSALPVCIHESDLLSQKRIWNKPPTKALMTSQSFVTGQIQ